MLTNDNLQLLVAELAEVDQLMAELSVGAVTSRRALQNRQRVLQHRLDSLSEQPETAAFVQLLFSGGPVLDSRAIDVAFAADALRDYQAIITLATAVNQGGLGSRGVVAGTASDKSRFFLTGVARGSFGFTLEENIESGSSFLDSTLKAVVDDVSAKISRFCDATDDEYDTFIQDVDKRLLSAFKAFFKLLHDSAAQMKIVGRRDGRKFDIDSINRAFIRTETTRVEDEERRITGILTGLADGMFNFVSANQTALSGRLAPTFGLEYRNQVESAEFTHQLGKRYSAQIIRRTTRRGSTTPHVAFFLVGLLSADNLDNPDTNWRRV